VFTEVAKSFRAGVFWDFADFASYFHAHSDTWDYNAEKRVLRMRIFEDKIGSFLKRARTPMEAIAALLKKAVKQDINWLPLDCVGAGLRMLSDAHSVDQGKDAQIKLLSVLKKMCAASENWAPGRNLAGNSKIHKV